MAGAPCWAYWTSFFIVDYVIYVVAAAIVLGVLCVLVREIYLAKASCKFFSYVA